MDPGSDDPWDCAQQRYNKFARTDPSLGKRLKELTRQQSLENKLAFSVETGRIYGLKKQKYDFILRKQLNRDWRHAPTQKAWQGKPDRTFSFFFDVRRLEVTSTTPSSEIG